MANYKDFKNKDTEFTGTKGIDLPTGTTGERNTGYGSGTLRFNSTTNLMEYYTGTAWKSVDSPPVITAFTVAGGSDVTSATIDNEAAGDVTIQIKGSLFDTTGGVVTFLGTSETLSTSTITRNSENLLTVTLPYSNFDLSNSPYTIKVENGSGLSASLADAISADQSTPTFLNAADTTVTLTDGNRGAGISAADLCGTTGGTAHSVTSGSLPTGLSMTSATGAITGTANAVGSDTTSTFTVTAVGDEASATRQFKIIIKAPVTVTYSSSGSYSFQAPSGLTSLATLKMLGGGGGGTSGNGAWGKGAGGGGFINATNISVTPGTTYSLTVGSGGPGGTGCPSGGSNGGNTSAFGNTANGGTSGGGGGAGGSYSLSNGSNNGSNGGQAGGQTDGDNQAYGGQNGGGSTYGSGAPGVPNYTPGPHAGGNGNGGAGGPSCQNGHRGGGNGSGGYLQFTY